MINPADVNILNLPSVPLNLAQVLPKIPALYFCISREEVVYIGITQNLSHRWKAHHKLLQLLNYPNLKIHWLAIAVEDISSSLERDFITHWRPSLNDKVLKAYFANFSVRNPETYIEILRDKELTLEARNVFDYLCIKKDQSNWVDVPQVEIAEELGIYKQQVYRAIKLLESKELIFRSQESHRRPKWRVNPRYEWKGSMDKLDEMKVLPPPLRSLKDSKSNPTQNQPTPISASKRKPKSVDD